MLMIIKAEKTINASLGKRCILARILELAPISREKSYPFSLPLFFVYRVPKRNISKGDLYWIDTNEISIEEFGNYSECDNYMKIKFIMDYKGKGKTL